MRRNLSVEGDKHQRIAWRSDAICVESRLADSKIIVLSCQGITAQALFNRPPATFRHPNRAFEEEPLPDREELSEKQRKKNPK